MLQYALSDYIQLLVSGISIGSIYVLIALGFITIYNVTGVINLAQGEFVMLGAMLAVTLLGLGLPFVPAALVAVAIVACVGVITHRLTIQPARHAPEVSLIMITLGTAIAVRGLGLLFWGTIPYALSEFTPGAPVQIMGAILSRQRLWIMGVALVVLIILYLFFEHTLLGKAVRACSINRGSAEISGVDSSAMSHLSYGISAGMSAVAGIVIAPLTLVTYDMGLGLGLKGFIAAIMGGMVSAPAAVVGGLVLGVLESFTAGLLTSGIKDGVAFLALFVVLVGRTMNLSIRRRRT
jgi:branched-chain amino acid transport system permease protein